MTNRPIFRDLATFPIPPAVLTNLTRAGYTIVDDILNLTSSYLSKEANISNEQASEILQKINEHDVQLSHKCCSAWELLQKEHESPSIVTFSESLDDMLNGGIPLAKITEFCGAPGTGKSQLCMQLCVDVQIPKGFGGLEGEVIFIDTEGSFVNERLMDIARASLDHCRSVVTQTEKGTSLLQFSLENILSGVHYYRCQDPHELAAVLHQIPEIIGVNQKVKLLVVDNLASPVRQGFDDLLAQNQFLSFVGQSLVRIAKQFEIAVVLTNQMTTKIDFQRNKSHLVPALGETWSHLPNLRIVLLKERNHHKAVFQKSPNKRGTTCCFQITAHGIRDVVDATTHHQTPPAVTTTTVAERRDRNREREDGNPAKKSRIS